MEFNLKKALFIASCITTLALTQSSLSLALSKTAAPRVAPRLPAIRASGMNAAAVSPKSGTPAVTKLIGPTAAPIPRLVTHDQAFASLTNFTRTYRTKGWAEAVKVFDGVTSAARPKFTVSTIYPLGTGVAVVGTYNPMVQNRFVLRPTGIFMTTRPWNSTPRYRNGFRGNGHRVRQNPKLIDDLYAGIATYIKTSR